MEMILIMIELTLVYRAAADTWADPAAAPEECVGIAADVGAASVPASPAYR